MYVSKHISVEHFSCIISACLLIENPGVCLYLWVTSYVNIMHALPDLWEKNVIFIETKKTMDQNELLIISVEIEIHICRLGF